MQIGRMPPPPAALTAPRDFVVLYVNGRRHEVRGDPAWLMLSDYLRYEQRLTGTKVVCAEGDCGACTVLVGRPTSTPPWRFVPVNSCVALVAQLDGCHIITIEGVAEDGELHEVQRAVVENHGSQCGFCTPGIVMAMLGHFEHHADAPASAKAVQNHLTGNLCRCTGYQPILDAAEDVSPARLRSVVARHHSPAVAADLTAVRARAVHLDSDLGVFVAPTCAADVVQARASSPSARLIAGNTDLGVLVNKGKLWPAGTTRSAISLHLADDLLGVAVVGGAIVVGGAATLTELERAAEGAIPELARLLHVFASPQIKAIGTLAGNVANGSPIGDTLPALLALDAELELLGPTGVRRVPLSQFYRGYKDMDLGPDELVFRIHIPIPSPASAFRADKVCQRKDLDISFVGAAYRLDLDGGVIQSARVAYGGVAATAYRLTDVEMALVGVRIDDAPALERVAGLIEAHVSPRSDVRGSAEARRLLSGNLFRRFAAGLRAREATR